MPQIRTLTRLHAAMCKFVTIHSSFESSALDDQVAKGMGDATDLNQAAIFPIRRCILGFEDALKFGFAIECLAAGERKEDPQFPQFDFKGFCASITEIYDIAVQGLVWDLYEDSDDEEESDSEEESSSEEESGSGEESAEDKEGAAPALPAVAEE